MENRKTEGPVSTRKFFLFADACIAQEVVTRVILHMHIFHLQSQCMSLTRCIMAISSVAFNYVLGRDLNK
jgi:hypothetical protein